MDTLDEGHPRRLFVQELTYLFKSAGSIPNDRVADLANRFVRAQRVAGLSKNDREQYRPVTGRRISEWRIGKSIPASWPQLAAVVTVLAEFAQRKAPDVGLVDVGRWREYWRQAANSSKLTPPGLAAPRHPEPVNQGDPDENSRTGQTMSPEELKQRLSERVFGQEAAVDRVVRLLSTASLQLNLVADAADVAKGPRGALLLAGPVGSGKRQLAGAVAEAMFGAARIRRFFMGEFNGARSADLLLGTPPTHERPAGPGLLAEWIRSYPRSVLLFEELERAHPTVMEPLSQLIEDGRLTDGVGRVNSFQESILAFTTNAGAEDFSRFSPAQLLELAKTPSATIEQHFRNAIQQLFADLGHPELFVRLERQIVVFDVLRSEAAAARIAWHLMENIAQRLKKEHDVTLVYDRADIGKAVIDQAIGEPFLGGRAVGNWLEKVIVNPLARWFFEARIEPGAQIAIRIVDGSARFSSA